MGSAGTGVPPGGTLQHHVDVFLPPGGRTQINALTSSFPVLVWVA